VKARCLLAVVLVLAVVLRLGVAVFLGDVAAPVSGAFDQVSYDTLAQRVLTGHGFSFPENWYPFTPAGEPTAHWSFLYTLFLSAVYGVAGHHPLAARLAQAVLSGLTGWFLFEIGRRLFDESVGMVAALLWAVYAYLMFFNAVLMTQTFYIVCLLAALEAALSLAEHPDRKGWVRLGVALGLGALLRQTLLLFAPFLLLWVVWQRAFTLGKVGRGHRPLHCRTCPERRWHFGRGGKPRPGWQRRVAEKRGGVGGVQATGRVPGWLSGPAATLIIIAACVLPFTLRNYLTYHDFLLLNSNGGFWFYASNHPAQGTNFDPNLVPPLPPALVGLSEPAMDRALFREALGFVASDPARFVQLSLNRTKDYFWLLPSEQSSALSNLARTLSFALYAPFMLLGLIVSFKGWRACMLLYMYLAFDTVLHLSSWAAPRYRLPSDTILMVFAALCLVRLAQALGARLNRAPRVSSVARKA